MNLTPLSGAVFKKFKNGRADIIRHFIATSYLILSRFVQVSLNLWKSAMSRSEVASISESKLFLKNMMIARANRSLTNRRHMSKEIPVPYIVYQQEIPEILEPEIRLNLIVSPPMLPK